MGPTVTAVKINKLIKGGRSPSRKVDFIWLNENPLKMMSNALYFTLTLIWVDGRGFYPPLLVFP